MFYPVHINLQNRNCLVVGGGTVAERKVVAMLLSGGDVTVISPEVTELLRFLTEIGSIKWHERQLKTGDTNGYFLVCAATDITNINSAVYTEAHDINNIHLVNVVDVIPQCTFAAASVVTDGDLVMSISTSGKSPATSRRIREYLENMVNATSLYTLGYHNGKPTPIENQALPYPVYLLLEKRKCVLLYKHKTDEIKHREQLLRQCGAIIEDKPKNLDNPFLIISDNDSIEICDSEIQQTILYENLECPDAGNFFTPDLIIDGNLIISLSMRNGNDKNKVKLMYKKLTQQFNDNGFGAFIDLLGSRRAEVLSTFKTSEIRAEFFENLIGHVKNDQKNRTCCLSLTAPSCSAECLFNWVRQGKIDYANQFISDFMQAQRQNT